MIRMIATDLDGTLLATGGMTVPDRNMRALARAVALFAIAVKPFDLSQPPKATITRVSILDP